MLILGRSHRAGSYPAEWDGGGKVRTKLVEERGQPRPKSNGRHDGDGGEEEEY